MPRAPCLPEAPRHDLKIEVPDTWVGGEIVSLLKSGSAYYAPSAAVTQMCESIVRDKKRVLPCSVWLEGEYGLEGLFLGVPCKLGRVGLEGILEAELTDGERSALERSAAEVKETMEALSAE